MSNALGMERKKELVGASDRSFGLMFAVVFALATGLIQLRFESLTSRVSPILLLLGSLSLTIALIRPRLLRPLNHGWMTFSLLLGRITSPIVLAVLFIS